MVRLRLASIALIVVAVSAACGGRAASPAATVEPPSAAPSATAPADPSAATEEPASAGPASVEPTTPATEEPVTTEEPSATEEPVETGATDAPTGGADACSGSADNRAFLEGLAKAVDWPVLCAVLPRGWFVSDGAYRLANGGKLEIAYKGPGGARLTLSEGAFCAAADGCVPSGSPLGAADLGPLDGTLYATSDGYAIIAAPGENPSWLLTAKGLDQAATMRLGADLAEVHR